MKLSGDLAVFQSRLGYDFKRPELLSEAVTHASISSATRSDNQRLEFLGDRVLGLVMAEALLEEDTSASEGKLAPRFNALVRKETCAEIAISLDLGKVLKLGRSEMMSGGRRKQALLGDALEAVIAAVYLDGGFAAAKMLVLRIWSNHIASVDNFKVMGCGARRTPMLRARKKPTAASSPSPTWFGASSCASRRAGSSATSRSTSTPTTAWV